MDDNEDGQSDVTAVVNMPMSPLRVVIVRDSGERDTFLVLPHEEGKPSLSMSLLLCDAHSLFAVAEHTQSVITHRDEAAAQREITRVGSPSSPPAASSSSSRGERRALKLVLG